jgi:hypothetical protein
MSLIVEPVVMLGGDVQESSSLLAIGGLFSHGQMDVDVASLNEENLTANNGGSSLACKM